MDDFSLLDADPPATGAVSGALLGAVYLGAHARTRHLMTDLFIGACVGAVAGALQPTVGPLILGGLAMHSVVKQHDKLNLCVRMNRSFVARERAEPYKSIFSE